MINKDLQNNAESEMLSVGDEKIQRMIKNLQRVDAPKDFDFRLKARIANAQPKNYNSVFSPALRYVLPFSAIVLIFTFVIIGGFYFAENNQQAAENVSPTLIEREVVTPNNFQTPAPETAQIPVEPVLNAAPADAVQPKIQTSKKIQPVVEEASFVAAKAVKKPLNLLPKKKTVDEGGGSRVSAASSSQIITPVGLQPGELIESARNNENKNDIITKQILLPLGIEIVSENGNRRVASVKKDSIAERSKVKVGDLVEAIDGEKVSGDAIRSKPLEGKNITVLRGTQKIEISLNK